MTRTCSDCPATISATATRCRSCGRKALYADPVARARMSEAKKIALADPVKRARVSTAAAETLRAWHREGGFDWSAWHRARSANRLAHIPEPRRDEYRTLSKRVGAVEAARIIVEDEATQSRRRVLQHQADMRARHERSRAEAY